MAFLQRLHKACYSGDEVMVKCILSEKMDRDPIAEDFGRARWPWCNSPMVAAIKFGNFNMLQLLLENGYSANALTISQDTHPLAPLHLAAMKNKPDLIELLLSFGADPKLKGISPGESGTAIEFAKVRNNVSCVKTLQREKFISDTNGVKQEGVKTKKINESPFYCVLQR